MNRHATKYLTSALLVLLLSMAVSLQAAAKSSMGGSAREQLREISKPAGTASSRTIDFYSATGAPTQQNALYIAREIKETIIQEKTKKLVLKSIALCIFAFAAITLIASAFIYYKNADRWTVSRYLMAATFLSCAIYVFVATYFDWLMGSSAAVSSAGSRVFASRSNDPLMFYLIIGSYILVGLLLVVFARIAVRSNVSAGSGSEEK